jgi:transcriptional regulator with XRE-family HTH domain
MTPEKFKSWRESLGLSQQAAADALGLSKGSIELYERGSRRDDGRPVVIPKTVQLACERATRLWKQGQPEFGPVSLIYADGPLGQPIDRRSRPPAMQIEQYENNEKAVNRACSLMNSPGFYNGFISDEDGVIWNGVELRAECRKRARPSGQDTKRTATCPICGLVAWRIILDGRPSLKFHIDELEQRCVEPSLAPEPFRCPHLLSAAMDEGWLEKNGAWKGWA